MKMFVENTPSTTEVNERVLEAKYSISNALF